MKKIILLIAALLGSSSAFADPLECKLVENKPSASGIEKRDIDDRFENLTKGYLSLLNKEYGGCEFSEDSYERKSMRCQPSGQSFTFTKKDEGIVTGVSRHLKVSVPIELQNQAIKYKKFKSQLAVACASSSDSSVKAELLDKDSLRRMNAFLAAYQGVILDGYPKGSCEKTIFKSSDNSFEGKLTCSLDPSSQENRIGRFNLFVDAWGDMYTAGVFPAAFSDEEAMLNAGRQ